jgi:hypothetical protein
MEPDHGFLCAAANVAADWRAAGGDCHGGRVSSEEFVVDGDVPVDAAER